jgi:hypothetical protein
MANLPGARSLLLSGLGRTRQAIRARDCSAVPNVIRSAVKERDSLDERRQIFFFPVAAINAHLTTLESGGEVPNSHAMNRPDVITLPKRRQWK